MPAKPKTTELIAFPASFRASIVYVLCLTAFSASGMYLTGIAFRQHRPQSLTIVAIITGFSIALLLIVASAIVRVDERGIEERWLFGKKLIAWSKIGAVEKLPRAYSVKTDAERDLMMLTLLSYGQQKAIAEETVNRAGLSLSREK